MHEAFYKIHTMSDEAFQEHLPSWIQSMITILDEGVQNKITALAELLLTIDNPSRYVQLTEGLFIENQRLYLRLLHEGSPEIGEKRRFFAG